MHSLPKQPGKSPKISAGDWSMLHKVSRRGDTNPVKPLSGRPWDSGGNICGIHIATSSTNYRYPSNLGYKKGRFMLAGTELCGAALTLAAAAAPLAENQQQKRCLLYRGIIWSKVLMHNATFLFNCLHFKHKCNKFTILKKTALLQPKL